MARPVHAVDQQNVEPAVAIVIEEGAAGAHGFGQILRAERAAVVAEVDAGRRGDVGQAEAQARARRPRQQRERRASQERPARHAMLTSPLRIA